MVLQANKKSTEYGGHLSSYASSATLYEVVSITSGAPRPSSTRRHGVRAGSFLAWHLRARLSRGRLTEEQLRHFARRRVARVWACHPIRTRG